MATLNTVKPETSAAIVAVVADADPTHQYMAIPLAYAKHRLKTSVWPVALTSVGVRAKHRCPSPVGLISAGKAGSGQMIGPESHRQPRHVNSANWRAHLWSVGQAPAQRPRQAPLSKPSRPNLSTQGRQRPNERERFPSRTPARQFSKVERSSVVSWASTDRTASVSSDLNTTSRPERATAV